MAGSAEIGAIVTAVLAGTRVDRELVPDGDRLVSALAALADGDPALATRLLAKAAESARTVTAQADILALQGNWADATLLYEQAVVLDHADPIAALGRIVAATVDNRATFARAELATLRATLGDEQVLRHYRVLTLICEVGEVCALSRDGYPVVTSIAQLAECERITTELAGLPPDDADLAAVVTALTTQVEASRGWRWRRTNTNLGILAMLLVLSLLGALGNVFVDLPVAIGALVVGAAAVFLYVVTNRRPEWELHAMSMAHLITAPAAPRTDQPK